MERWRLIAGKQSAGWRYQSLSSVVLLWSCWHDAAALPATPAYQNRIDGYIIRYIYLAIFFVTNLCKAVKEKCFVKRYL